MSRDDAVLLDMAKASRLVTEFVHGQDQAAFLADVKTQSAVLHQLLIVGEAAKRLSDPFRNTHSQIPWKSIAGMRDVLIHHYDNVDLDEVWRTVTVDVPQLAAFLQTVVPPGP
jgi:uncharacterized protein with HEPN domain